MKHLQYRTEGTCSKLIDIELDDDGRIHDVSFTGGCHGNLQGIAHLIRGMKKEDVIQRLDGICCGNNGTSCPDQLARALKNM